MKCKARITRTYKRGKSESAWPMICPSSEWIPNPNAEKYPVCGGDVSIKVSAVAGMYFGEVELNIDERCTKCKFPFHDLTPAVQQAKLHDQFDLTEIIDEIHRQE